MRADDVGEEKLADAAALGVTVLAGVLTGAMEGITIVDADRRWVYANPAACEMLGRPLEQLCGQDFLSGVPSRERAPALGHFTEQMDGRSGLFTGTLLTPSGAEREVVCSAFAIGPAARPRAVTTFRDVTGTRTASRIAAALAQATAHLVGSGGSDEILAGIARHAVEGTRALVCGIALVGDNHQLSSVGAYSAPDCGLAPVSGESRVAAWGTLGDVTAAEVIAAMTSGSIVLGDPPGKPVVLPGARAAWELSPVLTGFAATLSELDWQGGVYVPLSWESRVFGMLGVYLPTGTEPSEAEVAFYAALADQAAVAVTNNRLSYQAGQTAASRERNRLARELHDSVSQALFSMTMHARAAQLSMTKAGVDETSPLGGSIAQLAELTRGAVAEMRALISELRPGPVADEGLVAALRREAALLSAREDLTVTVVGPEDRLELAPGVEEHLYRIVLEALHNVVKHAKARCAVVSLTAQGGTVRVAIRDDGIGFDRAAEHPGHLGLSTMTERALDIGADLVISSSLGSGTAVKVAFPATADQLVREESSPSGANPPPTGGRPSEAPAAHDGQGAGGPIASTIRTERPHPVEASPLADAAALGLSTLAEVVARAQDAIAIIGPDLRYAYANTAACRMLGRPLLHMRGRDFLDSFPLREQPTMLDRLPEHLGDGADPFTCITLGSDDTEREVICSTFGMDISGNPNVVAILQDLTDPRVAARSAAALAQTTAELTGTATTTDVLAGIARHAVEGTRSPAVMIMVAHDDDKLTVAGAYGFPAPTEGATRWTAGSIAFSEFPGADVLLSNKTVVLLNARGLFETSPALNDLVSPLHGVDWQGAVCVPLSWQDRVFGFLGVFLPAGLAGPSEVELAFCRALADQAVMAVTNARLTSEAGKAAALLERNRLARELHDSVSQALFSITMHARAAQLSLSKAGLDGNGPLGRSVTALGDLTRGAMAEMRALIFELRPKALAEEGLVGALRKQVAAITARECMAVTLTGPEERLELGPGIEEHLYRIVSEALHNVVKHAHAMHTTVTISDRSEVLEVTVTDDGTGFDSHQGQSGHFGLSTMVQRAEEVGADLTVTSAPGTGTIVALSLRHPECHPAMPAQPRPSSATAIPEQHHLATSTSHRQPQSSPAI